jgi:eukaryotic-like serine/threonine-protein kinase
MTKARIWNTGWLLGVAVVSCIVLSDRTSDLIPSLEPNAYDLGAIATLRIPLDKAAVIAIKEQSLANFGRRPWSREILPTPTDSLSAAVRREPVAAASTWNLVFGKRAAWI